MSRPIGASLIAGGVILLAACSGAGPYPPRPGTTAPPQGWPGWPPRPPVTAPAPTAPATGVPYNDVEFEDAGVNPYVDPQRDQFSTFAMDVDTASYSVAKRFLRDGFLPARDSVRLEEYVNSFDYGYRPPPDGAFAIEVEGAPAPYIGSRAILLRIGIQAREVADHWRRPVALTFVIDTSGSMAMENRLGLVKEALAVLVTRLGPDDSVAIVRFGTDASIVLEPTSAAEPHSILRALDRLQSDGSTNAQAGLELGYDVAARGHRPGVRDRVVLASDGVANVGLTDADSILRRIDREVDSGVELVSVGVGMGNFNDVLLEQLADRGNGFYAYVNDRAEAERLFAGELTESLVTVAREARVQVEFDSRVVLRYRLLGYENRGMADHEFSDPKADAGEVNAGRSVTALYEIEMAGGHESAWGRDPGWNRDPGWHHDPGWARDPEWREPAWDHDALLGTVRLHWIDPERGSREEVVRDIGLFDVGADYRWASASFRLAATVGAFAEILRESPYIGGYTLGDVDLEAEALARELTGHGDVAEFSQLASMAARLADGRNGGWGDW